MGVFGSLGCLVCAPLGRRAWMAGGVWLAPAVGGCWLQVGLGDRWRDRSGSWLAADHQQVAAGSEEGWVRFDRAGSEQDGFPGDGVVPSIEEVAKPPGGALDAKDLDDRAVHGGGFLAKFVGVVEV